MKKFIKTLLLTFSLSSLFVSCHFLEVEQLGKSDIPSFFSDIDSVDPAVRGAYNLLYSLYDHYLITYPEVTGDLLYLSATNTEWWKQYEFTSSFEEETSPVGVIWKRGYNLVMDLDYMLTLAPKLREQNQELVDNALAQAYFIRALTFFQLCNVYGQTYSFTNDASHWGIGLMTSIPTITDHMVRSSVKDTYAQILSDIQSARELFTDNYTFDRYKASPYACDALEARIRLYMGDYEEAYRLASGLIGRFSLAPRDQYVAMFTTRAGSPEEDIFRLNGYQQTGNTLQKLYKYDNPSARPSQKLKSLFDASDVRPRLFSYEVKDGSGVSTLYSDICMKFYCTEDIVDEEKHYDPVVFRASEMYLIAAESACKLNRLQEAEGYIRKLEARALGISETAVQLSYSGADQLMELIGKERMKELCFEGHRLYDITRRHEALKRDAGSNTQVQTINYPDYRFVLQIPIIETEANPDIQQNPSSNADL
jgi:hypothetical protein